MKNREAALQEKRERLALYKKQEAAMLSGGAVSYGVGSRNLSRYPMTLKEIQAAIEKLESEIAALAGGGIRTYSILGD